MLSTMLNLFMEGDCPRVINLLGLEIKSFMMFGEGLRQTHSNN